MKTIKHFAIALTGLLLVACKQNTPEDYGFYSLKAGPEQEVLINYAANTLLSIRLADIAVQNAESEQLREFASTLAEDHQKIYAELEKLAAGMNIRLPQMFMQKQVDVIKMMKTREGNSFDKAYLDMVASYHRSFGDKMEEIMQETTNEEVLDFARLVDAQSFVHQSRVKSLEADINA